MTTNKPKNRIPEFKSQKSAIQRNFGAVKSNLPALTPQEEREAAELGIAEEAIKRMGS